jgi:hypothetical protein
MRKKNHAYKIVVGKPEGKRLCLHVDGRIVLKWILDRIGWYGLIDLAQERDQRSALVTAVMKLWLP